jgi:transitional endoplasmic reticulum ATPase
MVIYRYDAIKKRLQMLVNGSFEYPQTFSNLGVHPPSGILLHGPSGCGKTYFAKAIISNSSMNYISVSCNDIYSKYMGESEATIRRIFSTARTLKPCIIFFDEMDSIGSKRGMFNRSAPKILNKN